MRIFKDDFNVYLDFFFAIFRDDLKTLKGLFEEFLGMILKLLMNYFGTFQGSSDNESWSTIHNLACKSKNLNFQQNKF